MFWKLHKFISDRKKYPILIGIFFLKLNPRLKLPKTNSKNSLNLNLVGKFTQVILLEIIRLGIVVELSFKFWMIFDESLDVLLFSSGELS